MFVKKFVTAVGEPDVETVLANLQRCDLGGSDIGDRTRVSLIDVLADGCRACRLEPQRSPVATKAIVDEVLDNNAFVYYDGSFGPDWISWLQDEKRPHNMLVLNLEGQREIDVETAAEFDVIICDGDYSRRYDTDAKQAVLAIARKVPRASVVAVTRGAEGSYTIERQRSRDIVWRTSAISGLDVADGTAAGESFAGYLLIGLACGHDVAFSLKLATAAAAITVQHIGLPQLERAQVYERAKQVRQRRV